MQEQLKEEFVFGKKNYMIMIVGVVIIIIGFLLMIGGGAENPEEFNRDIFNFQRITLAPLLSLAGYGIVMYAIMKKPEAHKEAEKK